MSFINLFIFCSYVVARAKFGAFVYLVNDTSIDASSELIWVTKSISIGAMGKFRPDLKVNMIIAPPVDPANIKATFADIKLSGNLYVGETTLTMIDVAMKG